LELSVLASCREHRQWSRRQTGAIPGFNTAEGQKALFSLISGSANTAVGWYSLFSVAGGSFNAATGAGALLFNTNDNNTAFGAAALLFNTTGVNNTAVGTAALLNSGDGIDAPDGGFGSNNTAVGYGALTNNTHGNGNTALGYSAGANVNTANNVIAIGSFGQDVDNSCFIGNIYSNIQPTVGTDPDLVTINSNGRLGRANVSSRRYKHDIQPMHTASEAIYALQPVSFRYHKQFDQTQTIAFGLIAEEVAEVNPDLVGRNREGQPESVRYEQINAMLLNEFLKEHCKNEEQEATIARQQKQIDALTQGLQEVSAQLETSKFATGQIRRGGPAPQLVNNP
jgi:hypothetical protein